MDNNENMVVKKEKGSNGKNIIIIILVFIIALLLGIMLGQYISNNSKTIENNSSETEKDNTTTNNTKEDNKATSNDEEKNIDSTQKTDEEIVKELFTQHIIEVSTTNAGYKIQEYKIDSVNILRDNDRASAVDIHKGADGGAESFPDTDIFASIDYSIKPVDINNSGWLAGVGVIENGWIKNFRFVHIVKENGTYKISDMGTSW